MFSELKQHTQFFNPSRLPAVLKGLASTPKAALLGNQEVQDYLRRAIAEVNSSGRPVARIGLPGATTSAQFAKHVGTLGLTDGAKLSMAILSAMSAEVPSLDSKKLAQLAQECLISRLGQERLWKAIADAAVANTKMGASMVVLLDSLRRAREMGHRPDEALRSLVDKIMFEEGGEEIMPRQLVKAIASICRLYLLGPNGQRQAIHVLMDRWLSKQKRNFEGVEHADVVSLAVSLCNVVEFIKVETSVFREQAAKWMRMDVDGASKLSNEDRVVLLWAIMRLTPTGLGLYPGLTEKVLASLRGTFALDGLSANRLDQVSSILIAARHAMGRPDDVLENAVASAISKHLESGNPSPRTLAQFVTLWNQVGPEFWSQNPSFVDAVMTRATVLVEQCGESRRTDLKPNDLQPALEVISSSSFADCTMFLPQFSRLLAAVDANTALRDSGLAEVLRKRLDIIRGSGTDASSQDAAAPGRVTAAPRNVIANEQTRPAPGTDLPPTEMARHLGRLCQAGASDGEILGYADVVRPIVDRIETRQLLSATEAILKVSRGLLVRLPGLVDVIERLGDQFGVHAQTLPTPQLVSAIGSFADARLPHHFLFERVASTLLERRSSVSLSYGQGVSTLEAFASVQLRLPELEQIYSRIRAPQELSRLPTMALLRFLYASARLDIIQDPQADVQEIVERVLAETTPSRPLPLESSVVLVQCLYLSSVVLPDRLLLHLFGWIAKTRIQELKPAQIAALKHYFLFLLCQTNTVNSGTLVWLPIEVQTFASNLLGHKSGPWAQSRSAVALQFRDEFTEHLQGRGEVDVEFGSAVSVDLLSGSIGWLLNGPEAFFRPYVRSPRMIPQVRQRGWLLDQCATCDSARNAILDFLPSASTWPRLQEIRRVSWREWERSTATERGTLARSANTFCVDPE